jgi:hypothetical protein
MVVSPYIPVEYGSWIRPNIIRINHARNRSGDSGVRSTSSVQSSLVMYPGNTVMKSNA